jgi:hypothetical protein
MTNDEQTADLEQQDNNTQEVQENQEVEETLESQEQQSETEETKEVSDEKDWKAEALKYKAILDRNKNKPKEQRKSDDLDYGEKAFLKASGIESSEFDFVKAELKQSGFKDLDSLLENDYFKSKLENQRALDKTKNATIKGKSANGVATNSVEYWMAKPIEDVPADMRIKVINAKLEKEKTKGIFYNS